MYFAEKLVYLIILASVQLAIRYICIFLGAAGIGLPGTWEKISGKIEVPLKQGSKEYSKVEHEFTKSGGRNTIQQVNKVFG